MTALFLLCGNLAASREHHYDLGCHLLSPCSLSHIFAIYFSILICCSWQCAIISKQCRSVLHRMLTSRKKNPFNFVRVVRFEQSHEITAVKCFNVYDKRNERPTRTTDRPRRPTISNYSSLIRMKS